MLVENGVIASVFCLLSQPVCFTLFLCCLTMIISIISCEIYN